MRGWKRQTRLSDIGAPSEATSRRWCFSLAARCSPQPKYARLRSHAWIQEPDGKKESNGVVVVAHVKIVRVAAFTSREKSHKLSRSAYLSRLGVFLMREMSRVGRIRRVKGSQQGYESHHSFAYTITSCTQRYFASRPERRIIDPVLLSITTFFVVRHWSNVKILTFVLN